MTARGGQGEKSENGEKSRGSFALSMSCRGQKWNFNGKVVMASRKQSRHTEESDRVRTRKNSQSRLAALF